MGYRLAKHRTFRCTDIVQWIQERRILGIYDPISNLFITLFL